MGHQRAADLLVDTLAAAGVERIYGITGDSANFITDAVARRPMRFIHTRHEESAAFAAAAEATATGRLAVCMGSCGPGSLHLLNGLYEAHRNRVPVLAIATEIPSSQIGTQFIQEIDTRNIFSGCSDYCEYARTVDMLPHILGIAMQNAISHRGVAVIIIPGDISSAEIDGNIKPSYLPHYTHQIVRPCDEEIEQIAKALNDSKKITIYGGAGCIGAEGEVMDLAAKIKAPLMWTYRAKEALDFNNPYPAGMAGIIGTSAGDYAMHNCDTLLLLGCSYAFTSGYPDNVKIIQIDLQGNNLSRRHSINMGFVGDIKATLQTLTPYLNEREDSSFAELCVEKYNKARRHLLKISEQSITSTRAIYPEHLMQMLNTKIARNAWVTADMGTPWAFAGRYIESLGERRFCCSSLHGTMAAAMPFSIGLALAKEEHQIVAICGDGGLSMLLGELLTIKQEKLSPKIFVLNNSSLDFVAMEMKADGLLDSYTYLENPNFADVATAMGIKGIRVERVADLEHAIDEALNYDGAVLVDVVVDGLSMLIPPKITVDMVEKYSLYIAKMLRAGNAEELLEEFVTNLRVEK